MNKQFSLGIPKPCSENWANFTPASQGGFCASCNKIVIDFTTMNEEEIFQFFKSRPEHACGRFRPGQLKAYALLNAPVIAPGFNLARAGIVTLLLMLLSKPIYAQTTNKKKETSTVEKQQLKVNEKQKKNSDYTVRGAIRCEDENDFISGVIVQLKGSQQGTFSDADGQFEFPQKLKAGDVLIFSFIGYKTTEYVIPEKVTDLIDVNMDLDMVLMGEVAINEVYTSRQSRIRGLIQRVKSLF